VLQETIKGAANPAAVVTRKNCRREQAPESVASLTGSIRKSLETREFIAGQN
jgi:hypothetical protein